MYEIEHLPPQNIEAEQQFLGSVMVQNDIIRHTEVDADDFYKESHRRIFKAMQYLSQKAEPIDFVTMQNRLQAVGDLELIGGVSYLISLVQETPTAANAKFHAEIIKGLSQKRQILKVCLEASQKVREVSIDETLAFIRKGTQAIVTGQGSKIVSYQELTKMTFEFVENRYAHQDKLSGITSGFIDIDELTDGWQKTDYIILGARPSMGKSALSQVFCENAGIPCGIIQIEMGEIPMGIRSLSRHSTVPLWKLRKGKLSSDDWHRLAGSGARLSEKEIYIDFASRRISEIERSFTKLVELYGVQFVVVDYLQLADGETGKHESRAQEVSHISKLLKHQAKTHHITVMALAQLSRDIEKRPNKKPTLADLKESGQIEQDADIIIFLYEDLAKFPDVAILDFAKGRNIGAGEVHLVFDKRTMTFKNCMREEY